MASNINLLKYLKQNCGDKKKKLEELTQDFLYEDEGTNYV